MLFETTITCKRIIIRRIKYAGYFIRDGMAAWWRERTEMRELTRRTDFIEYFGNFFFEFVAKENSSV